MKKVIIILATSLSVSSALFSSSITNEIDNNSLVIYNSNIGLVHEERALELKKSENVITYEGVANSIETDSVNVKLPRGVKLYSQQYRFDKLTQDKLLNAHIEKEVDVKIISESGSYKIMQATLLANNGSSAIVQTVDRKIITLSSSDVIFKTIPNELVTKPSLVWNVEASKNIQDKIELDYLINDISFKSDYILNINENSGSLSGWITINNRSGKKFTNTNLSLLAGDINRVQNRDVVYKQVRAMAEMDTLQDVSHQAYEGYHFYTIPFKVTLANNENTQLKFLQKDDFKIQREYSVMLFNPLYLSGEVKSDVNQFISLSGFDTPLPKGVIRTYSKLNDQTILLGENSLEHTPKDTPIKLNIGKNFDVKVTQKVLKRNDDKKWLESEVEYTIVNASTQTKNIQLLIPFNKQHDSKIKTEQKYSFTKGNLVTFSIEVQGEKSKSFKVNFESKK